MVGGRRVEGGGDVWPVGCPRITPQIFIWHVDSESREQGSVCVCVCLCVRSAINFPPYSSLTDWNRERHSCICAAQAICSRRRPEWLRVEPDGRAQRGTIGGPLKTFLNHEKSFFGVCPGGVTLPCCLIECQDCRQEGHRQATCRKVLKEDNTTTTTTTNNYNNNILYWYCTSHFSNLKVLQSRKNH